MQAAKGCPYRLTPNLSGIAFGTSGLAQCWAVADDAVGAPQWPADVLWITAGTLWLTIAVAYLRNVTVHKRLSTELPDPVMGPFTALGLIIPMPLGIALAAHARGAGEVVFAVALVLTVIAGSRLTGLWIRTDTRLPQWHPAYFLPPASSATAHSDDRHRGRASGCRGERASPPRPRRPPPPEPERRAPRRTTRPGRTALTCASRGRVRDQPPRRHRAVAMRYGKRAVRHTATTLVAGVNERV